MLPIINRRILDEQEYTTPKKFNTLDYVNKPIKPIANFYEKLLELYKDIIPKTEYKYIDSGVSYVFEYTSDDSKKKYLKFIVFKTKDDKDAYIEKLKIFKDITTEKTIKDNPNGYDNILCFIEDGLDIDSINYYNELLNLTESQRLELIMNLEQLIDELLDKLIKLGYNCYDLKLENIFLNYYKSTYNIKNIIFGDLDPDLCKKYIDSTNMELYKSQIKYSLYKQTNGVLFKSYVDTLTPTNIEVIEKSLYDLTFDKDTDKIPFEKRQYFNKYLKYKNKYLMLLKKFNLYHKSLK